MKIFCQLWGHRRSASRARYDYDGARWRSVCKHCSEPMVRIEKGEWLLEQDVPPAEPAS